MNPTGNDSTDRAYGGTRIAASSAPITAGHTGTAIPKEFDALVADAEDLMKNTVDTMGSQTAAARAKLQSTLNRAKEHIASQADSLSKQARIAATAADDYVRDRPWQAVGVAAVLGLAIGALLGRR